jgi:hypothetical protein
MIPETTRPCLMPVMDSDVWQAVLPYLPLQMYRSVLGLYGGRYQAMTRSIIYPLALELHSIRTSVRGVN